MKLVRMHTLLGAALLALALPAGAETVVIVHAGNAVSLDDEAIARLFLRQVKTFPDGAVATPVNQKEGTPSDEFRARFLKKNAAQFKAYWTQQLFTGGAKAPQELDGDEAVLKFVAETPGGIGYVDAAKVKGGVRVVRR